VIKYCRIERLRKDDDEVMKRKYKTEEEVKKYIPGAWQANRP
jgi:hypothetical protein